jgi:UDP-N-acetylmuramoylalanine--D-glutamate ligase
MQAMRLPLNTLRDVAGRRVVVLGLARSGVASARALADAGARVAVYDRRGADALGESLAALGDRGVELVLAAEPAEVAALLATADLVVTSPSVSAHFPTTDPWLRAALAEITDAGVPVVGEVDLVLRFTRSRVLAVTGTKGKTTTTALIGAMLGAAEIPHVVGGNIGRPLIEEVDQLEADAWAVLELSELQLPTISRGVDLAVYTNIGADHLDRHGSVAAYRAVKARLAELSVADGRVILNADDPGCLELGARLAEPALLWYGLTDDDASLAGRLDDGWLIVDDEPVLLATDVPLDGRHQLADVLAAAVAAHRAGAGADAIARATRAFRGVPHRLETLVVPGGVRWVNDSQATIPFATLAALDSFAGSPLILITGGQGKGLDYGELGAAIAARCRAAILIGETAGELERAIGAGPTVERAATMDEAVRRAAAIARDGEVVLLSPAAASFDMFADYAARGEAFRAAVTAVTEEVER